MGLSAKRHACAVVDHNGYVTEGFATEETLKMDDFGNNGWEARTVGDVSTAHRQQPKSGG